MALITCPECGKQISETTPACPHCGYQLSAPDTATRSKPTEISPLTANKQKGLLTVIGSAVLLLLSPVGFALFVIPGVCLAAFGVLGIVAGISDMRGTHAVRCPYCGKESKAVRDFEAFKCPACKKRSVRDREYLRPFK